MLIKKIEALLVNKIPLPAFVRKCIKFKEMFANPPGIPFQAYFSEINKTFYAESSKPFTFSSWSWDWPILWPDVMAFNGNMGSWAVKPPRGCLPFAWVSPTVAQLNWVLLFTSSTRISVQREWTVCSDGSWQSAHSNIHLPLLPLKGGIDSPKSNLPCRQSERSIVHASGLPDGAQTGVYIQFPSYYSPNLHLLGKPLQGHLATPFTGIFQSLSKQSNSDWGCFLNMKWFSYLTWIVLWH